MLPPSASRPLRLEGLLMLQTFFNLVVATVVVFATELTIQWNNLGGVNDATSAGQIIPIVIAVGTIVRLLYVRIFKRDEPSPFERRQIRMNEFFDFPEDSSSSEGLTSDEEEEDDGEGYRSYYNRRRRRHRHQRHRSSWNNNDTGDTRPARAYRRNRQSPIR